MVKHGLLLLLTSSLLGGMAWSGPALGKSNGVNPVQVVCTVRAAKTHLVLGESPTAEVEIRNTGSQAILLVGNLDGSSSRRRYPHAYFEVEGPPGGVEAHGAVGCGGPFNPLREKDFVLLEPGSSFDPHANGNGSDFFHDTSLGWIKLSKPGGYRIVFHYSTDQRDPGAWNSKGSAVDTELVETLRSVPPVTISCSTDITVDLP